MKGILFRLLMAVLNPEMILSIVRIAISALESAVKSTSTDWDDKLIMPVLEKLKKALGPLN